ncbi:ero1-like protein, partial [Clonorchis sinensis]
IAGYIPEYVSGPPPKVVKYDSRMTTQYGTQLKAFLMPRVARIGKRTSGLRDSCIHFCYTAFRANAISKTGIGFHNSQRHSLNSLRLVQRPPLTVLYLRTSLSAPASNALLPTRTPQIISERNCGSYNHCTTTVIVTLTEESCFPKVSHSTSSYLLLSKNQGHIGDVHADIEYVNHLNNYEILPRLQSIVNRDYFHYFEINLARGCPFFSEPAGCRTSDCHVSNCRVEEVPVGLRTESMLHPSNAYHKAYNTGESAAHDDVDCELGKLDSSLSEERRTILGNWTLHDAMNEYNFCDMDDPTSENMIWVDLLKNPEQFTGYKGVSSARIWHMIYAENCFNEDSSGLRTLGPSPEALRCLEKRVFYRMISGLHTSITVHLCAKSPRSVFSPTQPGQPLSTLATTTWGPKPEEFYRRFHPEVVPEGLDRLRSLYFAYLVELRALAKVAPYLRTLTFYTGNPEADADTQRAINDLLKVVK